MIVLTDTLDRMNGHDGDGSGEWIEWSIQAIDVSIDYRPLGDIGNRISNLWPIMVT